MKAALITSFQKALGEADSYPCPVYSVAVYQPKWLPLIPKLEVFDIRKDGQWIRPREYVSQPDPVASYRDALLDLYQSRREAVLETVAQLPPVSMLCCWCPYDSAAKRQLEEHGSYICHTAVVGEVLAACGVQVFYDRDRSVMHKLHMEGARQ